MVIGLISFFCFVVLIEFPSLMKTKNRLKTMIIYFFLIILGFTISFLQIIDKAPTSPSIIIEKMVNYAIRAVL